MNDADSHPPKAKKIVERKIRFFMPGLGIIALKVKCVVEPKRKDEMLPRATRMRAGIRVPMAPTLLSHLPVFRPTTFNSVISASIPTLKTRK
jgi:hypothetical protein